VERERGTIRIVNPIESDAAVTYRLNGFEYDMQPGFAQTFENDRTWTIEFESNSPRGTIRYRLSTGHYQFRLTRDGWDLFTVGDEAELPPAPEPMAEAIPP
jgi:hypothetical protein